MQEGNTLRVTFPSEFPVGSRAWAEELRNRAVRLQEDLDAGYLELGRILYTFYDVPIDNDPTKPPVCTFWGYDNVEQFAYDVLGMRDRKVRFLRRIFYRLEVDDLSELDPDLKKRIIRLGYSKTRELVGVLTPTNVAAWVEKAENCRYEDLSDAIRAYRHALKEAQKEAEKAVETGKADTPEEAYEEPTVEEIPESDWVRFRLYPDQKAIVNEALSCCEFIAKSAKRGHLLTLVCMDYLATNGSCPPGSDEFLAYLANLENLFGVRMIVMDTQGSGMDLLYGARTLQRMAQMYDDEEDNADSAGTVSDLSDNA